MTLTKSQSRASRIFTISLVPIVALTLLSTLLLLRLADPRTSGNIDYPLIGVDASQIDPELQDAELINIFASWCAPCQIELPYLKQAASQKNIRIIGIAYKDTPENIEAFLEKQGSPYSKIIYDPQGTLGLKLGITGVPETIALTPDNIIKARFQGAFTSNANVEELLK